MASPIAHFVVSMGTGGRILSQGSVSDALAKDSNLVAEVAKEEETLQKADEKMDYTTEIKSDALKSDGKLVIDEEIHLGHVSWQALKLFFSALGGSHSWLFWVLFLSAMIITSFINTYQTWWLGIWAKQYGLGSPSEVWVS